MTPRKYNISAVPVNIWFNKYGDHDHDGMMYVLDEFKPILDYVKDVQKHYFDNKTATELPPNLIKKRNKLRTYAVETLLNSSLLKIMDLR